jgi:hypothetical protein
MGEVIRIQLDGPDAEPGRIPAADVARLLQGYERALGRAAEARLRRQARTGRRGGAVEASTRLIFRGIERGSLIAEVELPDLADEGALSLDDAPLGELAATDVLELIEDPEGGGDAWVADALAALGDELGVGSRYSALTVELRPHDSAPGRRATLSDETRQRLSTRRAEAAERGARNDRVVGTLIEVDFERHRAQVLTGDRRRVTVVFDEAQADEIQRWLRRPGDLEGRIEYDPRSGLAMSVDLQRIVRPEQLRALIGSEDFGRHQGVEGLIQEQGVDVIRDLDALVDKEATDEELSAFLDALM